MVAFFTLSFGNRKLQFKGSRFDAERSVYHVHHCSRTFDDLYRFINNSFVARNIPAVKKLSNILRGCFPAWFLPRELVLKIFRDSPDGMSGDALFLNETRAYEKLKLVQGASVPQCYGQSFWKGSPVLLLQYVSGTRFDALSSKNDITHPLQKVKDLRQDMFNFRSICDNDYFDNNNPDQTVPSLTAFDTAASQRHLKAAENAENNLLAAEKALRKVYKQNLSWTQPITRSFKEAVSELTLYGVKGDFHAGNIIWCGNKVVIIDFDIAEEDTAEDVEIENLAGLHQLLRNCGLEDSEIR